MVIDIENNLKDWENRLSGALNIYHGEFHKPALRLLAGIHEMRGKLAIERAATQEAIAQFQKMADIAEEIGNADLITLALIHQSEMFRRRGWCEASFRRIATAESYIKKHNTQISQYIQGMLWKAYTINYFSSGDEQGFLHAIDRASEIAEGITPNTDTLSHGVDKVEMLQLRAQGNTQLWKPEKALTHDSSYRTASTQIRNDT